MRQRLWDRPVPFLLMNNDDYRRMTERLIAIAEADDRMVGLLALGSMADEQRLDEWSDHDFWVVVRPDSVHDVRDDPSWLPDQDRIIGWFVETEHGRSAVYDDGHLLEYAVFTLDELKITHANAHRVLIGDKELEQRMEEIAAKTRDRAQKRRLATEQRLGRLVVHLVIGLNRYGRGEDLSAHEHIRNHALFLLVGLLGERLDVPGSADLDNLDSCRRFEFTHPAIGRRLNAALRQPVPETVDAYLELIEEHLPEFGDEVLTAVRRLLSRARAARS